MYTEKDNCFHIYVGSLLFAVLIPVIIYRYFTKNSDYWKLRGIPYLKPRPFLVNFLESYMKGVHNVELERYMKLGKIYGYFEGNTPHISIGDPQLLKDIMVKDFHIFMDKRLPQRYVVVGLNELPLGDPISDNMITHLRGDEWKRIRMIVSSSFSVGKVKKMMCIFQECSNQLLRNIKKELERSSSVDVHKMFGGFTLDVIASAAFSANLDSINDPDNIFTKKAVLAVSPNLRVYFVLHALAPRLLKALGLEIYKSEYRFFKDIFLKIIEERKRTGQTRNDFLQLLIDTVKVEEEKQLDPMTENYTFEETKSSVFKGIQARRLTPDEAIAQCVVFILAGHHTVKTTLATATYSLATHPDEQEKVFQEIKEVLSETDGKLTYEALQNMKYLDNVISETLRMYPPPAKIGRVARADYKLGDTGITIPKGMEVSIPIYAIQRDPELFPEPDKFKPSRFSVKGAIMPYSFLSFGAGPRNCLGMRFALVEMKMCLAKIISVFHLSTSPETQIPLKIEHGMAALNFSSIYLQLQERKESPLIL